MGAIMKVVRGCVGKTGRALSWLSAYPYNRRYSINLAGDRHLEWAWVIAHLPEGPGTVLDFGWGGSYTPMAAKWKGLDVTALDRIEPELFYEDSGIRKIHDDVLTADLPENGFDVIISCSTVEHVGLGSRYGHKLENPDGDLQAMARLGRLMKPDGIMLLTIPVGKDAVVLPYHRVYGNERLPKLLSGYNIASEEYWCKSGDNLWRHSSRETALAFDPSDPALDASPECYAIGTFILKPDAGAAVG